MCGRYEQHLPALRGWTRVLDDWPDAAPSRINICPTQPTGTVDAQGYRERSWSLIPPWSKTPKLRYSTFNARGETLAEKSTFRGAWRASQRCLIPASAYFEWIGKSGSKQCHAIQPADAGGLCFAGLWEVWSRDAMEVHSCTIVTVAAAESIAWLHHRMPLMLRPDDVDVWLAGSPEEAGELICDELAQPLVVQPVSHPSKLRTGDLAS